jgi:hypothetical protein
MARSKTNDDESYNQLANNDDNDEDDEEFVKNNSDVEEEEFTLKTPKETKKHSGQTTITTMIPKTDDSLWSLMVERKSLLKLQIKKAQVSLMAEAAKARSDILKMSKE